MAPMHCYTKSILRLCDAMRMSENAENAAITGMRTSQLDNTVLSHEIVHRLTLLDISTPTAGQRRQ